MPIMVPEITSKYISEFKLNAIQYFCDLKSINVGVLFRNNASL